MNDTVLYRLTSPAGKYYIGITNQFKKRMLRHKRNEGDTALCRAFDKYGFDNFKQEILVVGTREYIKELEVKAIKVFGSKVPHGYNITSGGDYFDVSGEHASCYGKFGKDHPAFGNKLSDEARDKIAEFQRGKTRSPETRAKISLSMQGNTFGSLRTNTKHSEETKRRLSALATGRPSPNKGNVYSDHTKKKISQAVKAQYGNRKYVVSDGRIFETLKDLGKAFGYTPSGMGKVVHQGRLLPDGLTVHLEICND